jgi:hypothetical protein
VFKQRQIPFGLDLHPRIKDKIHQLLGANFIRPCRYADWVSNIVPVEKKDSNKTRLYIDFHNLNRETSKDEYHVHVAYILTNNASGNKIISFLARYN